MTVPYDTLHITTVHVVHDTRIFHKECMTLAEGGLRVGLLASTDRAETGVVDVIPLGIRRSRFARMLVQPVRAYLRARRIGARVFHLHDPELLLLVPLLARHAPVIWDSHEDLPRQVLAKRWIPALFRQPIAWIAKIVEQVLVRRAAAIISAEPAGAVRFGGRAVVVENLPLLSEFADEPPAWDQRTGSVLYVGAITAERGAAQMVAAMGNVGSPAVLDLVGPVDPPELRGSLAATAGGARTRWHGRQERVRVREVLRQARVGLVLLQPTRQYAQATHPVKLFEYMAAGVPFVCSDFPGLRELVGTEAGLFVDPTDVEAIADAIGWLLDHAEAAQMMGVRGRQEVLRRFSWSTEAAKLLAVYEALFSRSRPAPRGGTP